MKIYNSRILRKAATILFRERYLKLFLKANRKKNNNFAITLSFDCDYLEDIHALPKLLDILSNYSFKADFVCVGRHIEDYPRIHKRILKEGHEIVNHTYNHSDSSPEVAFNNLSEKEQYLEILKCDEVCRRVLGYSPRGFRIPHFGFAYTSKIYELLKRAGYLYSSSANAIKTKSNGIPFKEKGIWEFPVSNCPRHPFDIFDTWHSLGRGVGKHAKKGEFFGLFKQLVNLGFETKSYVNVYFDPQDVVNNKDFKLILDYLEENKKYIRTYEGLLSK